MYEGNTVAVKKHIFDIQGVWDVVYYLRPTWSAGDLPDILYIKGIMTIHDSNIAVWIELLFIWDLAHSYLICF